jgi:hypothetical protein
MLRAIAVATDTSDIVGTVELRCEAEGLAIHLVRASAYASQYVPAASARGRRAIVPYDAVCEVVDDGETLRLLLDASHVPFKRLVLAHFTRDLRRDHGVLHRRRSRVQLTVAGGAALGGGALVGLTRLMETGPSLLAGGLGAFVLVAGAAWGSQEAGRRVMLGGVEEVAERRAFFHELRGHLDRQRVFDEASSSLGPTGAATSSRGPRAAGQPGARVVGPEGPGEVGERGPLEELIPTLIAVGAAAMVALLAVFAGKGLVTTGTERADLAQASATASAAGVAQAPEPSAPLRPLAEPLALCMCQLPSSPYVPARVPRVSLLGRVERVGRDPKKPSLAIELAVVNNGATEIRELKGNVAFTVPGATEDEPRVRTDRGFYYEGALAGGAAVKWRLSGRGTGYRATTEVDGLLGEGDLAPAEAFARLLDARTRSVKIHGAMMLARMRDERAAAALEKLRQDAGEAEQPVLDSLARAAAPVYGCEVEIQRDGEDIGVAACVMNTGEEEAGPLDASVTLGDRRALGASGRSAPTPGEESPQLTVPLRRGLLIPPRTGVRVTGVVKAQPLAGRDLWADVQIEPGR